MNEIKINKISVGEYFVTVFAEDVDELNIENAHGIGDMDWDYSWRTDLMDYHGSVFTTVYIDKDGDGITDDIKDFLLADIESVIERLENDYVEFAIMSVDNHIELCGYLDVYDADDERPLEFYDCGLECGNYVPRCPYVGFEDEWDAMVSAFQSDELFIQLLVDCRYDENKTIKRDGYYLIINCNYCQNHNGCILDTMGEL